MVEAVMESDRRGHLVDVALRLFRDRGYRATGIDTILAESGVAKRTLYAHFRSKDELIVAAMLQRDREWRDWFREAIKKRAQRPADRLLAVFDALEEWFERPDFRGCMFINAAAEFSGVSDPSHREICRESQRHYELVRDMLVNLAEDAGAKDPRALADGLSLLMEGAIVTAQITGKPDAARQARAAAASLLTVCLPRSRNAS
jgi:AcrR family transcriptional regulator